jgi:ComF family protein
VPIYYHERRKNVNFNDLNDIIYFMNIRSLFEGFIDLILPPRCAICRKHSQEQICKECTSKIKYLKTPYCRVCGRPHDARFEGDFCHDCYLKKTSFNSARSVAEYEGVIKKALHIFKFNNRYGLKTCLGRIAADYLNNSSGMNLSEVDMMIPIPLSRKKLKAREYNQAKLLAEELSKHTGLAINDEILKRTRETTPQFELSRKERLSNLKDAFAASSAVKDKTILLIDDIYTTGATVKEASNALKRAGARKVHVLTIARAV